MKFKDLVNTTKDLCKDLFIWVSNLFNFDQEDRSQQLIPIRHEQNKPSRNIYHHNYELNLLKLLFIIVTMLLLIFLGSNLLFDH